MNAVRRDALLAGCDAARDFLPRADYAALSESMQPRGLKFRRFEVHRGSVLTLLGHTTSIEASLTRLSLWGYSFLKVWGAVRLVVIK